MARTYHLVTPLHPEREAAWKARSEIFFAQARARHDALSAARVEAILADERQALPMAA